MYAMVCGGRRHRIIHPEYAWLRMMCQRLGLKTLILGCGTQTSWHGALETWITSQGLVCQRLPDDFRPGHASGCLRYVQYLKLLVRHVQPGTLAVLALPGEQGTAYVVAQAERLGLPVYVYKENAMSEMTDGESPIPMLEDDIAEVPVPATLAKTLQDAPGQAIPPPPWGEHEALLQGFLSHLLSRFNTEVLSNSKEVLKTLDAILVSMQAWMVAREQSPVQLVADLAQVLGTTGLQLRHDPYTATVKALSPEGYAVQIGIAKQDTGELINALPMLTHWLVQSGYKPLT